MQFEFATATRVVFGPGVVKTAGKEASAFGHKALVVIGLSEERAMPLLKNLSEAGLELAVYPVTGEPTLEAVDQAIRMARQEECGLVVGYGGGSALDTGKAVAAMLRNSGDLLDYLEVVGRGKALTQPSAPVIAIPTTAGTGSEVTRNAVIGVPEKGVKVSLRNVSMLPKVALVDPELTYSLPPDQTASTGLDALTQVLEPYVSNRPNPLTDALCREGMHRAARSLRRAYENGEDASAREDMSIVSLFGGMALANAKLGAVHGFAAPLGGMVPAPHGAVCAKLLPYVIEVNLRALKEREPESPALLRYQEVAQILTRNPLATVDDGVAWIFELVQALSIPPLQTYGLLQTDIATLVERAAQASSMQGNPIRLTSDELTEIVERAF